MHLKLSKHLTATLVVAAAAIPGLLTAGLASKQKKTREEIAAQRAEIAARRAEHPLKQKAKSKTPAARVKAGDKQLYGFQTYCYDGSLLDWSGAVKVLAGATCPEPIFEIPDDQVSQAVYMNGKVFVVLHTGEYTGVPVTYQVYDVETWECETSVSYTSNSPDILPANLAYDHTTGKVYGSFYHNTDSWALEDDAQFCTVDFNNAGNPTQLIAEFPTRMRAMTFDAKGDLYTIDYEGDLYKVNKFTGETEATGVHVDLPTQDDGNPSDGFFSLSHDAMCCDWESGDFYISYSDDMWNTYIARFNPSTGEAEIVADYSYSDFGSWDTNVITGLYFIQNVAATETTTPAAPADLSVTAVGTELKAEVSFTMPTLDSEGNALDKDMTWTISDGKNQLATGDAHSGETVNETVEIAAPGRSSVVVTVALGEAVSNPADASVFFGCDTPKIFGTPTARAAGNDVTITWTQAEAINNGNLDPVTYTITRLPDDVKVAEGVTGTTYKDHIESDIKTQYSYLVTPFSGTVEGEGVTSRSVTIGKYLPLPYADDFSDEKRFLEYPFIDANNDDNIWEYSTKYGGVAMYPANDNDADDYLLFGPFKMNGGSTYTFHTSADGHNFKENIAIYVGTDPEDVKTFSTELLPSTELDPMKGKKVFDLAFEPAESGDYYFGIKACTEGASQFIYIYDVAVKEIGGSAPAAPSDFELIPEAESATIKFTLPEKSLNGEALASLTEARIYRDNTLIGTITEKVAPGAEITFSDTEEVKKGYHSYSAVAVSDEGEGKPVAGQLWRGLDFPGRPTGLRIWEDLNTPGLMHLTFNAPERGYYGGYVNPEDITYTLDYLVMGGASGKVTLGKGTEHTFQYPGDIKSQDIFAGSVYGGNSAGTVAQSSNWTTFVAYFGPALSLPIQESWAGMGQKSGIWGGQDVDEKQETGTTYWDIRNGSEAANTYDGDGGMRSISSLVNNGAKRILTPRFSVEGTSNPTLVFYYLYNEVAKEFNIEVLIDDQPIKTFKAIELPEANRGEWMRMEIPLSEFSGSKYLQLGFMGRGDIGEDFICIDNVTISDLKSDNLSLINFQAPVKSDVNEEVALSAAIRNNGSNQAKGSDYKVNFFKNDQLLESIDGKDINPDETAEFKSMDIPAVTDPSEISYRVEVAYEADADKSDNVSKPIVTRVIVADYPVVTDLEGDGSNERVLLSWSDPDMSQVPGVTTTESFENYETFAISNIGEWGLHDGDGLNTVRMATTAGVLDYPHIGEAIAWQVFDPAAANVLHSAWYARTGSKMLVSFQATTGQTNDVECNDWLISPELNGSEQVISFYARTGMKTYSPEVFDFMVSDKSDAVADFKPLAENVDVEYAEDWTEFTYRVPAGTRYFAIVHKSVGKLAMLVDDITYIPAGSSPVQLDLLGFNVYRDGKRLNDEPIGDNSYEDTDVKLGNEFTYHVSAVWDKGESRLSDPVVVKVTSGVQDVADYTLSIQGLNGLIRIAGGNGEIATVYDTAGKCVASVRTEGVSILPVAQPGVYIVRIGKTAAKVVVY